MLVDPMENTGERMIPEGSDAHTFWEHIRRYQFATRWTVGKRVLDVASGEGYGSFGLLKAGAASVTGVDVDEAACLHASAKYGLDARVGSAENIPVNTASIDTVVSFETIEHVQHPDIFIRECHRVLCPGGMLIISTPDKNLYSAPGKEANAYHCSEMTQDEFRSLLSKSFPNLSFFGQRPATAKWWSPISLISETSPWDAARLARKARQRICAHVNPERHRPVKDAERIDPAGCIAEGQMKLKSLVDWSAVRPLSPRNSWKPVFLIAVAQKER